ncbi:hypothetical protein [Clostridium gasigenes]|uniref:hypothetical protein n=1 Tax=Clostridium gasigenes TaxID=94869 RepID=UPI001C0BA569|nr:hypothetical protein [Clostridium gasigenes]MBU3107913.1 hypothetical protein [Clostridium gasigenes]
MCRINSLIEEIESNKKIIIDKSKVLQNDEIEKVNSIINMSIKHLTFSRIPKLEGFNFKNINGSLIYFNNLCDHSIYVGSYIPTSSSKCYYDDNESSKYELWLLWNNEFCVTKIISLKNNDFKREVIDYGKCAFVSQNWKFIWDLDNLVYLLEGNLAQNLTNIQNRLVNS